MGCLICGDYNIHVNVPGGDGYKFMTFLDSCDLQQLLNQPTHMHHALVNRSIALPEAAHILNKVQPRRYHCINMSNLRSDLKNTSFVRSLDNAVVDLYQQYVHDLGDVLNKHAPMISRLKRKDSAVWLSDSCQSPLDASLKELGVGPRIH